jgi:hypothetical protein|tara:strand:- start:44 stop:2551 length:2508 start_codon:yes stop_codon:yes gene_type:complete
MAEMSIEERANMTNDLGRNYEILKMEGTILVNKGKITQQQYYDKMRSKAIEYGIIKEDQYPGALPSGVEDFLRVSGNVVGGILGRNNPVAVGAGGALGQGIFDTANTFYTNYMRPGVQTKPLEQITEDVGKAFLFDAVATKAFDVAINQGAKLKTNIKSYFGQQTDEQLKKVHDKMKANQAANEGIDTLTKMKQKQEETIETAAKELLEEGIDPTRYYAYGASSVGEMLRGVSDAIGVIPGLNFPTQSAFKDTLKQVFRSATEGTKNRPIGFLNQNAFKIDNKNNIVRNEKLSEEFFDQLPLSMIRSAQKQAANRADEVSGLYAQFDNDLLGLTKKYGTRSLFNKYSTVEAKDVSGNAIQTSLSRQASELNEKLKRSYPEDLDSSKQFSKFLPQEIKVLIPSKQKEFKLQGLSAGNVTPSFKNQITPKQLLNLDTQLRNIRNASRVFTSQNVPVPNNITGKDVVGLRNTLNALIKQKDIELGTSIAPKKGLADAAYVRKENFLNNNQGVLAYANMENKRIQDAIDLDNLVNRANKYGEDINISPVGGIRIRGAEVLPKEMTAPQMLNYYMNRGEDGISSLSRLLNVTDEAGNVIKSTPQFRRLVFNEFDDLFDETLFKSLRETGKFDTSELRTTLGFIGDKKLPKYKKYEKMLEDAFKGQGDKKFTMKDLDRFTKNLDGLQPDPSVSKFLMRRVALSTSQGLSLKSVMPLAGVGAAGGAGLLGGLPALGLMFMFQRFMGSKYGRGEFAKATSKEKMKGFFNKMVAATKNFADKVNNKLFGRLNNMGLNLGNIMKFSAIDTIGTNLDYLADSQNARDIYGNPNEDPQQILKEMSVR